MTDNIKLPPMPKPHTPPVFATAANTPSVKAGYELGGYEKTPPLFDEHQLEAYAREAVRLNAQAVPAAPQPAQPLTDEKDALLRRALEALEAVYPYTDQLVDYSSTAAEWPLNRLPENTWAAIEAIRTHLGVKNESTN